MDPLRGIRYAEASGSRGPTPAGNPVRKTRKKQKPSSQSTSTPGPIPTPYLATAPLPVSSLSRARVDELASTPRTMILPSSYSRPSPYTTTRTPPTATRGTDSPNRRTKYATGLLAPPAIMPGGSSSTPRIQGTTTPAPQNPRRRSADRVGVGGSSPNITPVIVSTTRSGLGSRQRSEERLRDLGQANASMMSLGHLGQIMESEPISVPSQPIAEATQEDSTASGQRRRRRVVRAEAGLTRRPTVTREEGRALGVARGASMRRTNVWDGLPESSDPPPAFPFPTSATNRLPPAFETQERQPSAETVDTQRGTATAERPRSPPPTFEQAIGLATAPAPLTPSAELNPPTDPGPSTPRARPSLALQTEQQAIETSGPPSTSSHEGTQWASAPSSPVPSESAATEVTEEGDLTEDERADRRMWNADLLAGYTLEERVRRESERRASALASEIAGYGSEERRIPAEATSEAEQTPPAPPITSPIENSEQAGTEDGPSTPQPNTELPSPEIPPEPEASKIELPERAKTPQQPSRPDIVAPEAESSQTQELLAQTHPSTPPPTSPLQSPTTPRAMSFMLPPVVVSPFQPTPGFGKSHPKEEASTPIRSGTYATDQSIQATQNTEASSSWARPPKAMNADEQSQSGAESDKVVSHSPPSRKLTRGKAIRRSSMSPTTGPVRAESIKSQRLAEPQKPLFSSPGYTAAELEKLPLQKREHSHRASAPNVLVATEATEAGSRPLRQRMKSSPNIHAPIEEDEKGSEVLPPHREAALRRRESALGRMERKAVRDVLPTAFENDSEQLNKAPLKKAEVSSVAGPLIDLNEPWPTSITQSPPKDLQTLAATTAELLQLLEDQPVAESSSQGAAKAAALQAVVEMLERSPAKAEESQITAPRKKAPPPPPALKLRAYQPVTRKPSVLSSADTPITPRPHPPSQSDTSEVSFTQRAPAMPTRRPAPPPPSAPSAATIQAPSLPPRPSPPKFTTRPPVPQRQSSILSGTDSSVSEKGASVVSPMTPDYTPRPRISMALRPKGPRPPPVPVRPWNKVATNAPVDLPPIRPPTDRTLSDTLVSNEGHTHSPPRSISAVDLRARDRENRSPEYTDLDVYIARLEGSGREYEGFTHVTSFLGPAKIPAASSAALETLLPGLVQVDSRRTNAAGKTKLKLSLLGVRVTKCPICLSQFKDKDKALMLPNCGHVAHEICGKRWFRENRTCFVCREALGEEV